MEDNNIMEITEEITNAMDVETGIETGGSVLGTIVKIGVVLGITSAAVVVRKNWDKIEARRAKKAIRWLEKKGYSVGRREDDEAVDADFEEIEE